MFRGLELSVVPPLISGEECGGWRLTQLPLVSDLVSYA